MTKLEPSARIVRIRLCNSLNTKRELWIEPLGDLVVLEPLQIVEILISEQGNEVFEIHINESSLIVHGWVQRISAIDDAGNNKLLWGDRRENGPAYKK